MSRAHVVDHFHAMCGNAVGAREVKFVKRSPAPIEQHGRATIERSSTQVQPDDFIRSVRVPCLSVRDLLANHPRFAPPALDAVIIDAEGADFDVLLQFDLRNTSVVRPRHMPQEALLSAMSPHLQVIFEHIHLSEKEMVDALAFLYSQGLTLIESDAYNTVATRQSVVQMCVDAVTRETAELMQIEASEDELDEVHDEAGAASWIDGHSHLPSPDHRFVEIRADSAGEEQFVRFATNKDKNG